MRYSICAVALLALTACAPSIPDSASGVGFEDYDAYLARQQAREAELTGGANPLPPADAISGEVVAGGGDNGAAIAADTRAALQTGDGTVQASPTNPAPALASNPAISRENDFDVVSEQRSIETDAERQARLREQFQVVQPTDLPSRSTAGERPNIVQYALTTPNQLGQRRYTRRGINLVNRNITACAGYPSADLAQEDFLASGGPERDRKVLDPDGDGFACDWDPAPFRAAVRN